MKVSDVIILFEMALCKVMDEFFWGNMDYRLHPHLESDVILLNGTLCKVMNVNNFFLNMER